MLEQEGINRQQQPQPQPPQVIQLTPEQIRILKKCQKDSIFPAMSFGALCAGLDYWRIKDGFMKTANQFQAALRLSLVFGGGWIVARIFYQLNCIKQNNFHTYSKRMEPLPYGMTPPQGQHPDYNSPLTDDNIPLKKSDSINFDISSNYNNYDTYAPSYYDDNVPNIHGVPSVDDTNRNVPFTNTYDDLRERNRRHQQQQGTEIYRPETTNYFWDNPRRYPTVDDEPRRNLPPQEEEKPRIPYKSKYGDDFQ